MIVFGGRGILLDVEGTTSSISFVYDVLFAFARQHVGDFLWQHRLDPAVQAAAAVLATETGAADATLADPAGTTRLALAAIDLMNRDVKSTPLKALQGMIWRSGFDSGELVSHVFDDVPETLAQWADSGLDVRIYSSGSIDAQKLFFSHTCAGDLTPHLRGHYDTTTGPKREAASYRAIAADMGMEPREILFISDVGEELDAARQAGMATALAIRPGNREPGGRLEHESLELFTEIVI
ncbi:MAG: acireductone synthase [Planctomycetia bacterium]|nr:acireductone synthase [Planctomycetia bacterium]